MGRVSIASVARSAIGVGLALGAGFGFLLALARVEPSSEDTEVAGVAYVAILI